MKKVFAMFLCLVMILSMTACGGNATTETKPANTTASASSGGQQAAPEVPALKGPGNVTLKRLGYNTAFDPNTDINAKVMEESTGYHVEYFMLPAENAD